MRPVSTPRHSDADNAVPGWAGRCATLTLRDLRLTLLLHNSFVVVVGVVVVVVVVGTFHVHAASPSLCGSGRCARLPAAAAMTRAAMWECRGLGFGGWPLWVGVSQRLEWIGPRPALSTGHSVSTHMSTMSVISTQVRLNGPGRAFSALPAYEAAAAATAVVRPWSHG
jgi:hypothetical protein